MVSLGQKFPIASDPAHFAAKTGPELTNKTPKINMIINSIFRFVFMVSRYIGSSNYI